ncbi:MAG TPA: glycosyltransferase, partial [Saprospiraceae bacterium]|nr:glycosyltransferase [Saprospiraceae bacterium]
MKVSVIIVSYNVYPFLDNCLRSVQQALRGIASEIIVVDNASVDRTPQLVRTHFPDVMILANETNTGFAKANNQGIRTARGEYILLLNPDTVVSENTITACIDFMDRHPEVGAAGVRMIDGSGKFLPESKRGLPTLYSSFMKMTGLYRLAPRSKTWNRYYQGHIGEQETAPIEVLTGAFMFIRDAALRQAGLLDEDFFMYGEDIDLSYRITKAGYNIYYLPTTSIIHYKGESTRKASLNYLVTFYHAMLIFTQKHPEFKGQKWLIQLAIYLHGFFRIIRQFFNKAWPVMVDAIFLYGSFYLVSRIWAQYYFHNPQYFTTSFYAFSLPLYTGIVLTAMFLQGAYDQPRETRRSWIGFFTGVIMVLVIYAFLPAQLRTSRMVIGFGSLTFSIFLLWSRSKYSRLKPGTDKRHSAIRRNAVIVAGTDEANRIKELINRSRDQIEIIGLVAPQPGSGAMGSDLLGDLSKLEEIVKVNHVNEIIYSAQDVPFSSFSASMSALGPAYRYMLAASTTMNIVGSMNRDTEGEAYGLRINFKLSHPSSLRSKRMFD